MKDGTIIAILAILFICVMDGNKAKDGLTSSSLPLAGSGSTHAKPDSAFFEWSRPQPIRCLQKALIDLGYDCGENAPDGVIGAKTMEAYKHWDKHNAGLVEIEWEENEQIQD